MKRLLGRLRNKNGSVLFLVVVVMSLLIIAASATFYVVSNQNSAVTVRYSNEQSYQTALSISDTVSEYIDGYIKAILKSGLELDSLGSDHIISKMLALDTGGVTSISTNDIDFSDLGMGNVNITIKKTKHEAATDGSGNSIDTFEVITTADVNGETTKLTQVKQIVTGPTEYFTRFLTSTGGDPADVTFAAYKITSDAYFENEYTRISGIGHAIAVQVSDSIYSSGTMEIEAIQQEAGSKKIDIVVAEDLIFAPAGSGNQSILDKGGRIFVGRNFSSAIGRTFDGVEEIYVVGDLDFDQSIASYGSMKNTKVYVGGDCKLRQVTTINSEIYVNGDLYLAADWDNGGTPGKFFVSGDVYLMGNTNNCEISYGGTLHNNGFTATPGKVQYKENLKENKPFSGKFNDNGEEKDVAQYVLEQTARNEYETWNAEGYFDSLGVTNVVQPGSDHSNICTIKDNCILKPSEYWSPGGTVYNIIIDTTGLDKDIYIKLQPLDGSNTFRFVNTVNCGVNVIVKGPRSVIFVLPNDVNFEMNWATFVGHMESAMILKGTTDESALLNQWLQNGSDYTYGSALTDKLITNTIDSKTTATILDKTTFPTGVGANFHNNIFLVTKGTSNVIDATNGCTFLGYIYAPNAVMKANGVGGAQLAFMGGMIVGSYTYIGMGTALCFTTPYDYNNIYGLTKPTDIVKHLIAFANSGGTGGAGGGSSSKIEDYKILGYK